MKPKICKEDECASQYPHAEADEVLEIDFYAPNYAGHCEVCGQSPTVTGVKDGKVVYTSDMCGPCTWGEAACLDPDEWNK